MDPQVPINPATTASNYQEVPQDKHGITVAAMALFVLLSLGAVAFLYYQNQQLKTLLASYQTSATSPTPSATPDVTANWKTFSIGLIDFKYPQDWTPNTNNIPATIRPPGVQTGNYPAITISTIDNPNNLTIKQYNDNATQASMNPGLYSYLSGNKEVVATEKDIGNVKAYYIEGVNCEPLSCDHLSFSYKGQIYVLTDVYEGMTNNNSVNRADMMRPVFNAIISTIKFIQ